MIDDVKLTAIQKQLERIERGQFLLACMIALIGMLWAFSKLFPIMVGPFLTG